ncbi:uncharacterized protein FIBRA_02954 [Fibroporia radiculosa]|uniref:Uncharacterized protein n=1 Tax=Fibroporia radiculosa TaxID=599839 RepID=J4G3L0_9APHY|nr:uncharacterized protein FIBRA_02954 [Fibroporia radiculosa]CCM00908.1 predicted protein [Fibroporia radiculosa]
MRLRRKRSPTSRPSESASQPTKPTQPLPRNKKPSSRFVSKQPNPGPSRGASQKPQPLNTPNLVSPKTRMHEGKPTSSSTTNSRKRRRTEFLESARNMDIDLSGSEHGSENRRKADDAIGLLTPEPSQNHSTMRRTARSKRPSIKVRAAMDVMSEGRGKTASHADEDERGQEMEVEMDSASERSEVRVSRPGKRRRLDESPEHMKSRSRSSVSTHLSTSDQPHAFSAHENSDAETEVSSDMSFHLLGVPDVAAVPLWCADLSPPARKSVRSSNSLYVPPGVSELIEGMKHALDLENRARRRAEDRYADEVQKRIEAEHAVARLAEQNRALEAEARVWAQAASDAFAQSLSPQLSQVDPSPAPQLGVMPSQALQAADNLSAAVAPSVDLKGKAPLRLVSPSSAVGSAGGNIGSMNSSLGPSSVMQSVAALSEATPYFLPLPA